MGFLREWRVIFAAGLIAAMGVVYGLWHHTVYKSGETACQATYTAAAVAQDSHAQVQISTERDEYGKIDQELQKSTGFSNPVSPIIGDAISRMRSPSKYRPK